MKIKEISKEIHEIAVEKGFYEEKRNVGEMLMLVVSELAKALEADRKGAYASNRDYMANERDFIGSYEDLRFYVTESGLNSSLKPVSTSRFEKHVKNTFEDELADAVIRILDIAEGLRIDLEWHIRAKVDYNKTRPHKLLR